MKASVVAFLACAHVLSGGDACDRWNQRYEAAAGVHATGRYAEALSAYQQILREVDTGDEHAYTALIPRLLNGIGSANQDLGHFDEAERAYRRSLLACNESHGCEAAFGPHVLANLGGLYLETHQLGRLRDTARTATELLAKSHSRGADVARLRHLIGLAARVDKRYDVAISEISEALAVWRSLPGRNEAAIGDVLNSLGAIAYEAEDYPRALTYLRQAADEYEVAGGPRGFNRAATLTNIACVYVHLKMSPQATEAFERALDTLRDSVGLNHPYTAQSILCFAAAWEMRGDKKRAREYRRRADSLLNSKPGVAAAPHVVDIVDLLKEGSN